MITDLYGQSHTQGKMNPEVKKIWLKALRSGEYEQAYSALKQGDKFCCLGVLCDLHAKETGGSWDDAIYNERFMYLNDPGGLPSEVQQWAGLRSRYPYTPKKVINLASMNDAGKTFEEIAEVIEEEL